MNGVVGVLSVLLFFMCFISLWEYMAIKHQQEVIYNRGIYIDSLMDRLHQDKR